LNHKSHHHHHYPGGHHDHYDRDHGRPRRRPRRTRRPRRREIAKRTGAITHLSTADYERCERTHLLDGYLVRLDPLAAEAVSAGIRGRN
jgi:hypothetical protein